MTETVFRLGPRAIARQHLEQHLLQQARAYIDKTNGTTMADPPEDEERDKDEASTSTTRDA